MVHVAVVVNWYGPYTLEEAKNVARQKFKGGLYLGAGRRGFFRGIFRFIGPLYVGKSDENLAARLHVDHEKLSKISSYRSIWLGDIITGSVPGERETSTPIEIHLSEWVLVHFMELPLNEKLRSEPPPGTITILNRWWKSPNEPIGRPHFNWPDLIDYRGTGHKTRLVRFSNKTMTEVTVSRRKIRSRGTRITFNRVSAVVLFVFAVVLFAWRRFSGE